jgi:phosphoribosylaminoimidazole-succinocarboxamide synthase
MKLVGNVEIENVEKIKSGKVREMFAFEDKILIVTTDRISAFDFILPSLIPFKGAVLNKISIFWFDYLKDIIKNHLIEISADNFPKLSLLPQLKPRKSMIY